MLKRPADRSGLPFGERVVAPIQANLGPSHRHAAPAVRRFGNSQDGRRHLEYPPEGRTGLIRSANASAQTPTSRGQGEGMSVSPFIDEIYRTRIVRDASENEYDLAGEVDSAEGD